MSAQTSQRNLPHGVCGVYVGKYGNKILQTIIEAAEYSTVNIKQSIHILTFWPVVERFIAAQQLQHWLFSSQIKIRAYPRILLDYFAFVQMRIFSKWQVVFAPNLTRQYIKARAIQWPYPCDIKLKVTKITKSSTWFVLLLAVQSMLTIRAIANHSLLYLLI